MKYEIKKISIIIICLLLITFYVFGENSKSIPDTITKIEIEEELRYTGKHHRDTIKTIENIATQKVEARTEEELDIKIKSKMKYFKSLEIEAEITKKFKKGNKVVAVFKTVSKTTHIYKEIVYEYDKYQIEYKVQINTKTGKKSKTKLREKFIREVEKPHKL